MSVLNLDEVSVKHGTLNDYDAVLNINRDLYDGFDFLPSTYKYFFQHPRCYMFLAVYKEQVVGFVGRYLIDEDDNLYLQMGHRVMTKYQGMGIFKKLDKYANNFIENLTNSGKVKYACFYDYNELAKEKLTVDPMIEKKIVTVRMYYVVERKFVSENITQLEKQVDKMLVTRTQDTDELISLVCTDPSIEYLNRCCPIIQLQGHLVFMVSTKNVENLMRTYHTVVSIEKDTNICNALSVTYTNKAVDGGCTCVLNYNGKSDIHIWSAHIVEQLQYIFKVSQGCEKYRFIIRMPDNFDLKKVDDFLRPALGEQYGNEENRVIYIEISKNNG